MMGYALTPGSSWCNSDGRIVFLSLEQDRYFALSDIAQSAFQAFYAGGTNTHDIPPALLANNLVRPSAFTELAPCLEPLAVRQDLTIQPARKASMRQVATLFVDVIRVQKELRVNGLARALDRLSEAKSGIAKPDIDRAIAAGNALELLSRIRSAKDKCLPLSLALAHYLIRQRQSPKLVIGVSTRPFRAHCWVQVGNILLSDRIDAISDFTPILTL